MNGVIDGLDQLGPRTGRTSLCYSMKDWKGLDGVAVHQRSYC